MYKQVRPILSMHRCYERAAVHHAMLHQTACLECPPCLQVMHVFLRARQCNLQAMEIRQAGVAEAVREVCTQPLLWMQGAFQRESAYGGSSFAFA